MQSRHRRSIGKEILNSLREYNRKGRFVGGVYGTDLSPTEAYVIVELDVDSSRSISSLAQLLEVEKSTISRSVASLIERGYLSRGEKRTAQRTVPLSLTEKGTHFLKIHDHFNDQFIERLSKGISPSERNALARQLDALADGTGAAPLTLRPSEHALLSGMRRLARTWSALGGGLFGTDLSITEWHILSFVKQEEDVTPSILSHELTTPKNTLSLVLKSLKKKKLISLHKRKEDKRSVTITLTKKGEEVLENVNEAGTSKIVEATRQFSQEDLEKFNALLGRYVSGEKASLRQGEIILQPEIKLFLIRGNEDLQRARSYLLQWYLAHPQESLPSEWMDPQNSNYLFLSQGAVVGVAEVRKVKDSNPEILRFHLNEEFEELGEGAKKRLVK